MLKVPFSRAPWAAALCVLLPALAARAETPPTASFEQLFSQAEPVHDLPGLVESLGRVCEQKDDAERRQCEQVRRSSRKRVTGTRFVAAGDAWAVRTEPFSAKDGGHTVVVRGCLLCASKAADGHYLSTAPLGAMIAASPGLEVARRLVQLSADDAPQWLQTVAAHLRVQFVFGVGANEWFKAGARGYQFNVLGWRLFDHCTGAVLASQPESSNPAPIDAEGCPAAPKAGEAAASEGVPDRLSPPQIMEAMEPVKEAGRACAKQLGVKGSLVVRLDVAPSGKTRRTEWLGPLAGTKDKPSKAQTCLEPAVAKILFPPFRLPMPPFEYPVFFK